MLEEGYIGKYSHGNSKSGMIKALKCFNEAIAFAMEFVLIKGDVLLVVTADHETGGITLNNDGEYQFTIGEHSAVIVNRCFIFDPLLRPAIPCGAHFSFAASPISLDNAGQRSYNENTE